MPFAAGLRESLQIRGSQVPLEFTRGDSLEHVLNRHLMTVERMGDGDMFTSILLLSPDGKRLSHGAAPNLPESYRKAIDGLEIGPSAGSCGTATFFGRPIYVTDIATDPLWADYRHLALPHGLRSCWSTPIFDNDGAVIGSFAIYHATARGPSREEIDAIDMIAEHVAEAILWARDAQDLRPEPGASVEPPRLKLVEDHLEAGETVRWSARLLQYVRKLELMAEELDRHEAAAQSEESKRLLRAAAADSRRLISAIRHQIEQGRSAQ